jgi:hypothetical protein
LAARGGAAVLAVLVPRGAGRAGFAEALPGRIGTFAPLFAAFALGMAGACLP